MDVRSRGRRRLANVGAETATVGEAAGVGGLTGRGCTGTAAVGEAAGGGGLTGRGGPPEGAGVQKDMVTSDAEE